MNINPFLLLLWSITLYACVAHKAKPGNEAQTSLATNADVSESALNFAEYVLKENLRIRVHERRQYNYLDVQMIFHSDNFVTDHFVGYTSYSNQLYPDNSEQSNYDGFILFVATYKKTEQAKQVFDELKTNTQTRITELKGSAGLFVEQVQVFEKIRKTGGLITQKDEYVFFLVENCEAPLIEDNWSDYENLFLKYITEDDDEIEVINANCDADRMEIQRLKVG